MTFCGRMCGGWKYSTSNFISVVIFFLILFSFVWYSTLTVQTKFSTPPALNEKSSVKKVLPDQTSSSASSSAIPNVLQTQANKIQREKSQRAKTHEYKTNKDKTMLIDDSVAKAKLKGVRVFCWILSQEKSLKTKVVAVNTTWGRRCDGKIFIITTSKIIPEVVDLKVKDGRSHLTEKTIAAMKYLYKNYLNDFDWFLKADDDTYIIMENLKYLLSHYDYEEGIYLGHLFKKYSQWGYMSGGAGYVISKEALRLVVEKGYNVKGKCSRTGTDEDVEFGHCLHAVGITVHDTRDRFDRESFHPYDPEFHLTRKDPGAVVNWDRHPTKMGDECCSQLTISFHYTNPNMMHVMEFLLYRTSVYGRRVDLDAMKDFFKIGTVPPLKKY